MDKLGDVGLARGELVNDVDGELLLAGGRDNGGDIARQGARRERYTSWRITKFGSSSDQDS